VPLDWAKTQVDLGTALNDVGQRESGREHLQQAIDAFRLALPEITRERVPLDWATTQMDLSTALRALGERESGTEHLQQAVDASRLALQENTRERVPLQWANTQYDMGLALFTLGSEHIARIGSRKRRPASSKRNRFFRSPG